jgi:hypothetical protein
VRGQRQNLLLFNLVPLKLVLLKAGGGEQTPSPEEAEVMRRRTSAVAPAPAMLSEAGPLLWGIRKSAETAIIRCGLRLGAALRRAQVAPAPHRQQMLALILVATPILAAAATCLRAT